MTDHAKTAREIVDLVLGGQFQQRIDPRGAMESLIKAAIAAAAIDATAASAARVAALEAENAALREALDFYARGTANPRHRREPEGYDPIYGSDATAVLGVEFGTRARALLSSPDGERRP